MLACLPAANLFVCLLVLNNNLQIAVSPYASSVEFRENLRQDL
jgi:hypothetical protein